MKQETRAHMMSLLKKERDHHAQAIEEIDMILDRLGETTATSPVRRGPGRPRGSKNTKKTGKKKASGKKTSKKRSGRGMKAGGSRVQGVKQTLEDALTASPQSPAELKDKVSKKLGHEVSIATQLHMLKSDGKAKAVGRGQWVKA